MLKVPKPVDFNDMIKAQKNPKSTRQNLK